MNSSDDGFFEVLPRQKYSVIYADPPWQYRTEGSGHGNPNNSSARTHYPTVALDDLKSLAVASIAEKDCVLFMWTTGPKLEETIETGNAWGFTYTTIGFVWDKVRTNCGYYTLSQCELCLIFKKGRIPQPRGARNVRQLLRENRGEHSAKPVEIRHRINDMFPGHRKIELFARSRHKGWDAWGLETDARLSEAEREERR